MGPFRFLLLLLTIRLVLCAPVNIKEKRELFNPYWKSYIISVFDDESDYFFEYEDNETTTEISILNALGVNDDDYDYELENSTSTVSNDTLIESSSYKDLLLMGCGFYIPDEDKRASRIVGGKPVNDYQYPWIVSLIRRNHYICGGTLITPTFVMTAAHCIVGAHIRQLKVESMGMYVLVQKIFVHPDFYIYSHDAGLLKLKNTFKFPIPSVCIADMEPPQIGQKLKILGKGLVKENGPPSDGLHSALIEILPNEICNKTYEIYFRNNFYCAGDPSGIPDACQGDSGGPLLQQIGKEWYQVGIVSFGEGCGRPQSPGVYSKVAFFYDWIKNIITMES